LDWEIPLVLLLTRQRKYDKKSVLRPFGGPRNIICGQIIKQKLENKATGNDFTSRDPTVAS
jgi:hypothetical protein